MTPLDTLIRKRILNYGPMRLDQFMEIALTDIDHGYYTTRAPIGAPKVNGGDFTTAPEISQIFGDMLGLWLVDLWQRMGAPTLLHLVELGPGRGTLASDIARVLKKFGADKAIRQHLVEISPTLTQAQKEKCPKAKHHLTIDTLPQDAPIIIIANEFFDALPIRQYKQHPGNWLECYVIVDSQDALSFEFLPTTERPFLTPTDVSAGDIIEDCSTAQSILKQLCLRLSAQGGCFLTFDYGSETAGTGDTLQAMKAHQYADPLREIGLCDLTSHVHFFALTHIAKQEDVTVYQTLKQGAFLQHIGIDQRTQNLMKENPSRIAQLQAERDRLIAPDQMGALFKVFAIANKNMPNLAGLEPIK